MEPFYQCNAIDQERQKQSRREMLADLLKDKEQAKDVCGTEHYPSAYEIGDALDELFASASEGLFFKNDLYQVQVRECEQLDDGWPPMLWLSIRRLDREAVHDWRHFQQIKNELVGPEHEAFELYPRESRLVDVANQYHLFVFKDPKILLPVGFMIRGVSDTTFTTGKQRPRA